MIRDPRITENTTITICLVDGTIFKDLDITSKPFGDNENQVAFWTSEGKVRCYPFHQVKYFELNE